eukprot:ANDGO_01105.mRNA.1 Equilibrative nucleotide transporter 1
MASEPTSHVAYWIFLLLGVGVLLPWNIVISAPDYFSLLYGPAIEFYFSIAFSYPNLLGLLLLVKFGHRMSFMSKTVPFFAVFFAILVLMPLLTYMLSSSVAMGITVAFVVIMGVGTASTQAGSFGLGGALPFHFTQALMAGNGVSGVFVCLLRIITKATMPASDDGIKEATIIYFEVAAVVMVAVIISLFVLRRIPYIQQYIDSQAISADEEYAEIKSGSSETSSLLASKSAASINEVAPHPSTFVVLGKIKKHGFLVWCVFFVTLGIFPGLCVVIPSYQGLGDWFPVILITTFNVFDTAGRTLAGKINLVNETTIVYAVLARLLFIPLFVFCVHPAYFQHDSIPIILMVLMAFSNGYLGSTLMMWGPGPTDDFEKQTAGTMMSFFLLLGISCGSSMGLGLSVAVGNSIS